MSPNLPHKTPNSTLAGGPHLLSSNWESAQAARWLTEQDTNRDIHETVHLAVITQTASWRRQFQALNIFIEFDKLKACFIDFIILAAVKWVGVFLNFCPFVNDLGSAACR